jgi:hypothetical protein
MQASFLGPAWLMLWRGEWLTLGGLRAMSATSWWVGYTMLVVGPCPGAAKKMAVA